MIVRGSRGRWSTVPTKFRLSSSWQEAGATRSSGASPSQRTVKIIARNVGLLDYFALSPCREYAWDLAEGQNELLKISLESGEATRIAGAPDSGLIPGGTSVVFGRTKKDRDVVYVTTSGGLAGLINGTYVEGAKVHGM